QPSEDDTQTMARPVGGGLDLDVEVGGLDVARDADDLIPGFYPVEFDPSPQWVFIRPETSGHCFIDNDHPGVSIDDLALSEISPLQYWNAHCLEEIAVDEANIDSRSACYFHIGIVIEQNGHRKGIQGQPPVEGQHTYGADRLYPGK